MENVSVIFLLCILSLSLVDSPILLAVKLLYEKSQTRPESEKSSISPAETEQTKYRSLVPSITILSAAPPLQDSGWRPFENTLSMFQVLTITLAGVHTYEDTKMGRRRSTRVKEKRGRKDRDSLFSYQQRGTMETTWPIMSRSCETQWSMPIGLCGEPLNGRRFSVRDYGTGEGHRRSTGPITSAMTLSPV